jgi:hypothetical protein
MWCVVQLKPAEPDPVAGVVTGFLSKTVADLYGRDWYRRQKDDEPCGWQVMEVKHQIEVQVHDAMDNAVQNGYDMVGGTVEALSVDLCMFAPELTGLEARCVAPFVRTWRENRERHYTEGG